MINQNILEGRWNEIKGKLRAHWGQLTDDDFTQAHGHVDQLIGTIQRKTGEGREAVERYLNELSSNAGSVVGQAAEQARRFSDQTMDTVQKTAKQAADQLMAGYGEAERMVRARPGESLAVCFAVGLLTGLLVSAVFSAGKSR
jgi:uncharacterized protein YjbJ (UPF0337 family)